MAYDNDIPKYNSVGGISEVWAYFDSLKYDSEHNSYHKPHSEEYYRNEIRQGVEKVVDAILELISL